MTQKPVVQQRRLQHHGLLVEDQSLLESATETQCLAHFPEIAGVRRVEPARFLEVRQRFIDAARLALNPPPRSQYQCAQRRREILPIQDLFQSPENGLVAPTGVGCIPGAVEPAVGVVRIGAIEGIERSLQRLRCFR